MVNYIDLHANMQFRQYIFSSDLAVTKKVFFKLTINHGFHGFDFL